MRKNPYAGIKPRANTDADVLGLDPNRRYEVDPLSIFGTRLLEQILVDVPKEYKRLPNIPREYQERVDAKKPLGGLTGILQNRRLLADEALRWDPSKKGYNPQPIIAQLQSVELVYNWEDPAEQREAYNGRIRVAVLAAGRNLLRDFAAGLEKMVEGSDNQLVKKIEQIYGHVQGVLELAPYYGGDNRTEEEIKKSAEKDNVPVFYYHGRIQTKEGIASIEQYINGANEVWNRAATALSNYLLGRMQSAATEDFDPRRTPDEFEKQREKAGRVLSRYRIGVKDFESYASGISASMYMRAADELFPKTLDAILHENKDKPQSSLLPTLQDINLTLNHAYTGGVSIARIREMAAKMLEAAEKNRIADHVAGYIQEGIGEKIEELFKKREEKDTLVAKHFNPWYEFMEKHGKEMKERAREWMNIYPAINYAIETTMKDIEDAEKIDMEEKRESSSIKGIASRLAERLGLRHAT